MDPPTERAHAANRTPGSDGADTITEARKKQQRSVSANIITYYDSLTHDPSCSLLEHEVVIDDDVDMGSVARSLAGMSGGAVIAQDPSSSNYGGLCEDTQGGVPDDVSQSTLTVDTRAEQHALGASRIGNSAVLLSSCLAPPKNKGGRPKGLKNTKYILISEHETNTAWR